MKKIVKVVFVTAMFGAMLIGCSDNRIAQLEQENTYLRARVAELEQEKANSITGKISSAYESAKEWVVNLF